MPEPRRSWARFLSWRLIGPAVVVAVVIWSGPERVWSELSRADLPYVLGAIALAIPLALIKGLRWQLLLRRGVIGFGESTGMYAMGMSMAAVTPGHLGDFVKVATLMKRGMAMGSAIAYNVVDRLLDVIALLAVGYLGTIWVGNRLAGDFAGVHVSLIAVAAALAVGVALRRVIVGFLMERLVPRRHREAVRASLREVVSGLRQTRLPTVALIVGLTAGFWMVQFWAGWLCARALGMDVPFWYLSACIAVATVASFVPITVAGAGTRDAVFIVLLGQIGFGEAQVVALSGLVLAVFVANIGVFYLVSLLCPGTVVASDLASVDAGSMDADAATPKIEVDHDPN